MSVIRVTCPTCGTAANVPANMANVRCGSCGTVWNTQNPTPSPPPSSPPQAQPDDEHDQEGIGTSALIAGLVGGFMFLIAIIGILIVVMRREPDPSTVAVAEVEETIKPAVPEPYREIRVPEDVRRRIYSDYRKVARTTVETPLILPQGTRMRAGLEDTLQKTFDRELLHFAVLHDITVEDVKEVIKEGDAKQWDTRPRSNAVRDGKRVYPKEMSEGWERNPNRK